VIDVLFIANTYRNRIFLSIFLFDFFFWQYKIFASGCWRMCCGRAGTLEENIKYAHVDEDPKNENGGSTYNVNRCSLEVSIK
jgi:hypothetical protein